MSQLNLHMKWIARDRVPADLGVGEYLKNLVKDAAAREKPPSALAVVRTDRIELVAPSRQTLRELSVGRLLAGLTTTWAIDGGPVEAVGIIGAVSSRPGAVTQVFLEWSDCSWWHWYESTDGADVFRQATLGDPLPAHLGRWWSFARRSGMKMQLHGNSSGPHTVH